MKSSRGSSYFALLTVAGGEILYVRWLTSVRGGADTLRALKKREALTAWVERGEVNRPHYHTAWQLYRGHEALFEFGDVIALGLRVRTTGPTMRFAIRIRQR